MVGKTGACEECVRTCQLLHWSKKGLEPRVTRFFKIMIGPDFNEAQFLPPKFAKTVKDLVDLETKLEDSRGICWTVTLSYYKDLLAFHKGWSQFSVDKDLKVGDFLVFNHIRGSHFVVHAFGKDGCEKLNAARKHPPVKRARTSENIAAENTPYQTTFEDARKRKSSGTSFQIQPTKTNCASNCEGGNKKHLCMDNEFCLMVDRDAEYVQSDYRTCLYDLSKFEMRQNICSAAKNKRHIDGHEGSPDHAQTSLKFQADGDLVDKNPTETLVLSMETAIASNTDTVENNKDSGAIGNMSLECDKVHLDGLSNDLPLAAASVRLSGSCRKGDDISNVAVPPQSPNRNSGNLHQSPQSSSRNLRNSWTGVYCYTQLSGSQISTSMLKYPLGICQIACHQLHFPGTEGRATVILEDPEGREWGGIYHEKFGFRVLVAPWHKVNAENDIQPGDRLVFSMADASLNKYKLNIVRKHLEN